MPIKIESTSSSKSEDLIRIFLKNLRSGVLATADAASIPHAAVIYYMLDDDLSVLFTTKRETQKFKNMEENKQAALVVYDESTQTTAQVMGHVEFVEDNDTREKVLANMKNASLERSTENTPPAAKIEAGDFVIVRLKPTVIKMAEYIFSDAGNENLFETILFSEAD